MVFLGAVGLTVGLGSDAARCALRRRPGRARAPSASRRSREGRTDREVPVSDGSEIGLLQAGFNRMVAGLRERERAARPVRPPGGRGRRAPGARARRRAGRRGARGRGPVHRPRRLDRSSPPTARRRRSSSCSTSSSARSWRRSPSTAARSTSSRAMPRCACSARPLPRDDAAGDALAAARSLCERLREDAAAGRLRHRRVGRRCGRRQHRRRRTVRVHRDRRPGQRGRAPGRARQGGRRPRAGVGRRARAHARATSATTGSRANCVKLRGRRRRDAAGAPARA